MLHYLILQLIFCKAAGQGKKFFLKRKTNRKTGIVETEVVISDRARLDLVNCANKAHDGSKMILAKHKPVTFFY